MSASRRYSSRLFIVGLSIAAIFVLFNIINSRRTSSSQRNLEEETEKPTVYTFVDPSYPYANDELFQIWTDAWMNAGWRTKALSLENAKMHPDYEEYNRRLDEARINGWHKQNFLRHVAMSTVPEGGFFSEHFVIPLNIDLLKASQGLPNEGKFTMHDGIVADLMSGSEDEWNRVTRLLMDNIYKNDVLTLFRLHRRDPLQFIVRDSTFSTEIMTNAKRFDLDCDATKDKIAVRFHVEDVMDNGFIPRDRLDFIRRFRKHYEAQCDSRRPVMHTFWSPRDVFEQRHFTHDESLLRFWIDSWVEAGWNIKVLTIEDAKMHPDFEEYVKQLDFHQVCCGSRSHFIRHIAMATVKEGGFFSEHFVFPLRPLKRGEWMELPNGGRFTLMDAPFDNILSGTQEEWQRMYRLMNHKVVPCTYLVSLESLKKTEPDPFLEQNDILSSELLLSKTQFDLDICDQKKMAVRFHRGDIHDRGFSMEDRLDLAKSWMRTYKARCLSERPVMHTFLEPTNHPFLIVEDTEKDLVKAWKEYWYNSGWEPLVLTSNDARRYPHYEEFVNILDHAQNEFDRLSYLRWLAMAASGGGWMSDLGTFPTNIPPKKDLPNGGNFTALSLHAPYSIFAGSASEWSRMAMLLMDSLKMHGWSDVRALEELQKDNVYVFPKEKMF